MSELFCRHCGDDVETDDADCPVCETCGPLRDYEYGSYRSFR